MKIINYIFFSTYLFNFIKCDPIVIQTGINIITNTNLINIKEELEREVETNFQKYLDYNDNKLLNFIPVVINKQNIIESGSNNGSDLNLDCIYNSTINIKISSNKLDKDSINKSILNIKPEILFTKYYKYICSYSITDFIILNFKSSNSSIDNIQDIENKSDNIKKNYIPLYIIFSIFILIVILKLICKYYIKSRNNQNSIEMIDNNI
jgi:hypothetical protein